MIEIKNLVKKYKNKVVLNIKYFHFKRGNVYLLCGANGSGKSTIIKSILNIIEYDGKITKEKCKIGYLPERFPEVSFISAFDFLKGLKCDKDIKKIEELASYFCLDLKKSINSLSKGNLQKLMIIQAVMNDADILIFDEPLNGLDNINQEKFLTLIKKIKGSNKCIIITTHYLKYYEGINDHIIFLDKGEIYEDK